MRIESGVMRSTSVTFHGIYHPNFEPQVAFEAQETLKILSKNNGQSAKKSFFYLTWTAQWGNFSDRK